MADIPSARGVLGRFAALLTGVSRRPFPLIAVVIATCALAACSSGGGAILPRTAANVNACKVLAQVVAGQARPQLLAGAALETNAPITHQLRQDLAQYAADAAQPGDTDIGQAKAVAVQDCRAIRGRVTRRSGRPFTAGRRSAP